MSSSSNSLVSNEISRSERDQSPLATFKVLGVHVSATQIPQMIAKIEQWIVKREVSRYVTLTNVHAIMEAHRDSKFKEVLNSAAAVCPDGMPLVWLAQMRGLGLRRRVYGPDLLLDFCRATHEKGYSHFFYGGAEGVPERLAEELTRQFPGLRVAGCFSPPFRPLTLEEDQKVVEMINQAAPDLVWVGLGCPKQEFWMREHFEKVGAPVMLGVGQAFDIYAGDLRQAPRWMRERGLEWFFRLIREPKRLWKRYLIYNSWFVFAVIRDSFRSRDKVDLRA